MKNPILEPYKIGDLELKNRMVMSPMTRSRSLTKNIPHELASLYYTQRASAGLMITEGVQISPEGIGYVHTPGNYTQEQQTEWKKITKAVHEKGGLIFLQLWHVGRVSHSSFHDGKLPPAPSAIGIVGKTYTAEGLKEFETPREMTITEIKQTIQDFKNAAQDARNVGFDGVDIHGAFGYLIDEFLCSGTNQRTDEYGGSVENRSRFGLEVIEAVLEVWDSKRVGIKLSPSNLFNGMKDDNPPETFGYFISKLNDYNLAYLHLMEPQSDVSHLPNYITNVAEFFRPLYKGTLIANAGMTKEKANKLIENGTADLVSFGSLFLANPDLTKRFELDAPLNEPNRKTYYTGGETGYTDYPFLDE
jgi:N-ethylmaleimide reductase